MFMLLRLIIGFVDQSSECSGNERTSCEVMFGITATFNVVTWFFCYRMQADLRWKKYKVRRCQAYDVHANVPLASRPRQPCCASLLLRRVAPCWVPGDWRGPCDHQNVRGSRV